MIEQRGLGAGNHEAFITDLFTVRAMNIKFNAAHKSEAGKHIDGLNPKIKGLYLEIKNHIENKDNTSFFIDSLILKDGKSPKEGFTSIINIGKTLKNFEWEIGTQELN